MQKSSACSLVAPTTTSDVSVCANRRASALNICALASIRVGLRPGHDGLLCRWDVLILAEPSHYGRLLQGFAVGKGHAPRQILMELVHSAKIDGCNLLIVLVFRSLA